MFIMVINGTILKKCMAPFSFLTYFHLCLSTPSSKVKKKKANKKYELFLLNQFLMVTNTKKLLIICSSTITKLIKNPSIPKDSLIRLWNQWSFWHSFSYKTNMFQILLGLNSFLGKWFQENRKYRFVPHLYFPFRSRLNLFKMINILGKSTITTSLLTSQVNVWTTLDYFPISRLYIVHSTVILNKGCLSFKEKNEIWK